MHQKVLDRLMLIFSPQYPNFDSDNIWFQVNSFLQIIFMLHEHSINAINSNLIIIHSNKRHVITTMINDKDSQVISRLKMNIRAFHIQILILKMSILGAFFIANHSYYISYAQIFYVAFHICIIFRHLFWC